jgi:hypothetical protein
MKKKKCKHKKGQIGIGMFLMAFIGIVVGISLFLAVAQGVGTATSTVNVVNKSLGLVSNSTTVYLTDYRSISNVVVYNATTQVVNAANYTVTNDVVNNGALSVSFLAINTTGYTGAGGVPYTWYISGTAQPVDYVGGAGRQIALLIPIFFALLIAVIALEPTLRSKVLEMMD